MTTPVGKNPVDKHNTLRALRAQWLECQKCPLGATRTKLAFADGSPDAKVMLIGEAPGKEEDLSGVPFKGPSGKIIEDICDIIGVKLVKELHLTNPVLCRPPDNRVPYDGELAACRPRLMEHIRLVDPDLIIASGKTAASALLRRKVAVTKERGQIFDGIFDGVEGTYTIPVLVTLHPATILRDPDHNRGGLLTLLKEDIKLAFQLVDQARKLWYDEPKPTRRSKIHGLS